MRENYFQSRLIKDLKSRFKGCIVMKTDAGQHQGIPDLLVLYNDKWAALECKRSELDMRRSQDQGNQPYYVERMNKMSYASYIYPENKKEVLDDLERAFGTSR